MGNTANTDFIKWVAAIALSFLMAASPVVAQSTHRYQHLSNNYLGYEIKELRFQSEGEGMPAYGTGSTQLAVGPVGQNSNEELWAYSYGESKTASEADSAQPDPNDSVSIHWLALDVILDRLRGGL